MRHPFRFLSPALLSLVACIPSPAANLTTTTVQGIGADWNSAIWRTNGTGTAVGPPVAGNTYQCIANGTAFGNNTANTRVRNPLVAGTATFPGDSLTLNTNTDIRIKQASGGGPILNFPGTAGIPGLILNGGVINVGDDASFVITGSIQVASQSYITPGDGGGGAVLPLRAINIAGRLNGSGTLVIFQAGTTVPQEFSGNSNTFSGQWILKAGWLLASGFGSLGTNSVTVDPGYMLPVPPFSSTTPIIDVPGPALFEPGYDMNSAGTLTLTNGGVINLHQNCAFSTVRIEGASLTRGVHSYAELAGGFPNNFASGGSGSLIVQPYGPPPPLPPSIQLQPVSAVLNAGSATQLVATASGALPLWYRWQKGTNAAFINLTDSGDLSGSSSNVLSFTAAVPTDAADFRLIVTNSLGATTSQVATVTVLVPDLTRPAVAMLNPPAGATVGSLAQIQVTFTKNVVGVEAADLVVAGTPAASVSGSGSNYVFALSQPPPGTIPVYWDIDNGITDVAGNPLDIGNSWTYTLIDNIPPGVSSTVPAAGACVGALTQAQILFSEPVTGVEASALLVNGVPAETVTGTGFGPYLFSFPQPAVGLVQFFWAAANNIRDTSPAANRLNDPGWTIQLDPPSAAAAMTNIVVNEFLAATANPTGLLDEDLELSDWIELYNRGGSSVNLAGWSLTDDPGLPSKWSFPQTNIGAGQFLVVFASGKDRRVAGANLHTNFKLKSADGFLALFSPDLPPLPGHILAAYPEQRADISYGLDASNNLAYFSSPTPGAPNSADTVSGVVAPVHFSVRHGFFSQPFDLLLTTRTPGAMIIYTTNGSDPVLSGNATNGLLYAHPITISRTTALRAAAFAPNLLPTLTESQTYLFVEDIVHQPNNPDGYPTGNVWTPTPSIVQTGSRAYYQMDPKIANDLQYADSVRTGLVSIPTLSIILPIEDLFDPVNGLYTHPMNRGAGWERPCSMELIFPDGSDGLQIDCGIQIQGGTQRDPGKNAKHSFRVNFKAEYGPGTLDFPMFPDSAVKSFNTLVLDGGINYWWHYVGGNVPADQRYRAQCVRDQFTSDLMLALGRPSWRGRFYHLYLNGLYWGLHYVHERPDEAFAASYLGGERSDYDVIRNTTYGTELVAGDLQAWNAALSLSNAGLTNNAQYAELQQYVDIDDLIDYMIVNHWAGNDDWPQHNWYVIRKRSAGEGFKFIVWDAEHVLKNANENVTTANTAGSPAQIYTALRNNAEFRLRYADHLQKHFAKGGLFYTDPNPAKALWDPAHPERNVPAAYYMKRIQEIDTAIVDESARWGGYLLTTNYTRNHWLRELNNLLGYTNNAGNTANYFPQRSAIVLSQYKAIGLYPNVAAPLLSLPSGIVPAGSSLTMTNPNSGGKIYYTTNGTDPRVYASGAVALGALAYTGPLTLTGNTVIKARALNGSWSALTEGDFQVAFLGVPIRITELMYNPIGGSAYEFLELQNIGASSVDLSGFSFEQITFVFPNGTLLAPGAVMVLGSDVNPAAFASRYPGLTVAGWFGGALANEGERIALLDRFGNTVISVDYQSSGGWPPAANGGGHSLEVIDPNGDPDDPANWRASSTLNGSPGFVPPPAVLGPVRLNEVMAENFGVVTNGGTFPDWVELANASSNAISLANWSLSNSGNPRKFIFPGTSAIPPGGYLVVWCDSQTNAAGLHTGFNLGRKGEDLFLYDAATNRIDAISFGLQLTNYTIGRFGPQAAWQLTLPTPGAENLAAFVGAATNLVINEWLANSLPGGADWIELYNTSSSQPVALSGLYLASSNELFQLRSLSFLGPREFIQLFADKNPGPDHLDFKLSATGDAIALYDVAGVQVDRVSFSSQLEGVSQGRFPDASKNIVSFPGSSSPGAANYLATWTGPVLNELMACNLTAVYDSHGANPDWLELYNPAPAAFTLGGLSLSTDAGKPGQWVFPAGTTLSANNYVVVWCDPSRPPSTNSAPDLNTGFALKAAGSAIYLFNTNAQIVDSVSFGFQVADFSIGRSGGNWALFSAPTPGLHNATPADLGDPINLRVNEWMGEDPAGGAWFELYNPNPAPVNLAGLYLTADPSVFNATNFPIPNLSFLAGPGWVVCRADGHPSQGPDHTPFTLDPEGGTLRLYARNLALIDSIGFGLQTSEVSQGRLPDGADTVVAFPSSPTPEASNYIPLENVFINEVLSHTDPPLEDAIELFNAGTNDVVLDGWFLSNSQLDLKKYRIPAGIVLPARGYHVFYEYQLNSTNAVPFTLNSAHGDQVLLSQADASGNSTGYRAQVAFGASENGVSFGRWPTSAGVDFVPLAARTFGQDQPSTVAQFRSGAGLTNSPPKVGPVVISEIMYAPSTLGGTNIGLEFIELFNATATNVTLYDPAVPANTWKVSGGIEYLFPPGLSLPPAGFCLLVEFDPALDPVSLAAFRAQYGAASNALIFGPYSGKLENSGETIELYRSDAPQAAPHPDAGFVPYILVDRIAYGAQAPWPSDAAGTGLSLQRRGALLYGNEALNWTACAPTPGARNCVFDSDGDGLPDDWELAHGLDARSAAGNDGAAGDSDGDGFSNLQEFLAGTDPRDPQSLLKLEAIAISGGLRLRFQAVAGHSYSIEYRDSLSLDNWHKLTDIAAPITDGPIELNDPDFPLASMRFYRLATTPP